MNIHPTVASALHSVTRAAALLATLALAACGSSQNWQDHAAYVTVGGTVTGLTGTVVLQNNGQDDLSVNANQAFTFGLSIATGSNYKVTVRTQPLGQVCTVANGQGTATAKVTSVTVTCKSDVTVGGTVSGLVGTVVLQNNGGNPLATASNGLFTFTSPVKNGATYSVTVRTQPSGQTCSVANGSGVATANVTNVAVTCAVFTLRPLPSIYTNGKAINFSAYRAGGPGANEIPSDADVLQDLGLVHAAGFRLLRLFGADAVAEKILRLAAANYPDLKFHAGIYLQGAPASCVDTVNSAQIAKGVALANQYANVVTVSVGNETSFAKNLPITCLASYVQSVRSQVSQPVTADDDYTFYAGRTPAYSPDTILPLLDFVSIHTYPISNYSQWDWQQTGVAAGPARAAAMMNASLDNAKSTYQAVYDHLYKNAAGDTVTVGSSLPIVVGETGWKAVQTNPGSTIETYAAKPVNAKWYFDLMNSWQGSAGGPTTVFYFEAFDETWKGTDDGWGLWDKTRAARYALCGTPVGAACNADVYQGAGYYPDNAGGGGGSSAFSTITFDGQTVTLTGFGGAEDASTVTDPAGGTNKVAKVVKSATAEVWAGTTFSTGAGNTVGKIPFSAGNTRMTVRVYSPVAGIKVRLKVEDHTNPAVSVETEASTTKVNTWEMLTFDFASQAAGTAALDLTKTYDRASIFFDFGVAGGGTAKTYYFDDVTFIGGAGGGGGAFNGVFAAQYTGDLGVPGSAKTTLGGDVGFFYDPRLASTKAYDFGGISGPVDNPGGVPNFYYGFGLKPPAITDAYFGAYVNAPGNGAVDVTAFTKLNLTFWGPAEQFEKSFTPAIQVVMTGPAVAGCGSNSGRSEVQSIVASAQKIGAASNYALPLSGFTLKFACSGETTVAQVLAHVTQVNISLVGTNIQYSVPDTSVPVAYPNGLNIGPISFN